MRRPTRAIAGLLAILSLLLSSAGLTLAQSNESPASGHAQVIAHGVLTMPADELTWRLYDGSAPSREDAQVFENEWPGFIIGGEEPVVLDVFDDLSVVLAGKAQLVRAGAELAVSSLEGEGASYGWLTLTAASLDEDPTMQLASDPFDAPDGLRQVDLVRDVLGDDEESEIAGGSVPTFLYLEEGEASVTADDTDSSLEAGEGLLIDGPITVEATDDDTILLAAVIGDELAPRPEQTPEGTVPSVSTDGAIEFGIRTCPPGMTAETLDEAACQPTQPDENIQILAFDGQEQVDSRTGLDAEPGQTGYIWTDLEIRTWVLQVFASGGESVYIPETPGVEMIPGPQYEITLTEDEPYIYVPTYRLLPGEIASTVTVTFLGCEEGQDPEFFLPENCIEYIEGSAAVVAGESDVEAYLGPEQAVQNEDFSLRWTYVEFDTFTVTDVVLPEGYVDHAFSENPVVTSPDAPDAYVYVYCFLPTEE